MPIFVNHVNPYRSMFFAAIAVAGSSTPRQGLQCKARSVARTCNGKPGPFIPAGTPEFSWQPAVMSLQLACHRQRQTPL